MIRIDSALPYCFRFNKDRGDLLALREVNKHFYPSQFYYWCRYRVDFSMALLFARTSQLMRSQGNQKLSHVLKNSAENSIGPCTVLAANLTAYPGGKAPRYKPWPYAEKGFKAWHMAIDRVDWRMDDNSKVIVVDGNLATGKTALAKHIAKEFDLLYVPDVTDEDMYWWETGMKYDAREKDDELPFDARTCDFQTFYGSDIAGGAKARKRFPRTQYMLFRYKLLKYAQLVTAHILSTGTVP